MRFMMSGDKKMNTETKIIDYAIKNNIDIKFSKNVTFEDEWLSEIKIEINDVINEIQEMLKNYSKLIVEKEDDNV